MVVHCDACRFDNISIWTVSFIVSLLFVLICCRFAAFFLSALPNSPKADIPKGILQGKGCGHVTVTFMV